MAAAAATVLLLPPRRRFAGQPVAADIGTLLADGLHPADGAAGEAAQLQRWFDLLPRGWPVAAITRARDAGDASLHTWLRADPCWVRAEMTGARVMAIGELGLEQAEADALVAPLRTLFGDAGMPISAPLPSRWYLAVASDAKLPAFAPAEEVLGADLWTCLPEGPEGRRWRTLLSEAQVILHNHPVNAARVAAGRPPANSLCFHGGGRLPDHVRTALAGVESDDALLHSLQALARPFDAASPPPRDSTHATLPGARLVDLRGERDWSRVEARIRAARAAAPAAPVELDFADGARRRLQRHQRWRFWRRPATALE